MAYKKTSEASLRKHDSNTKVKKAPVEAKKATPSAPKASPAPSTPSKPKASSGASTAPKKASGNYPSKVTGKPDAPVSSNRKKAGGARPEGPAAGMPKAKPKAVVGSGGPVGTGAISGKGGASGSGDKVVGGKKKKRVVGSGGIVGKRKKKD